MTLSNHVMPLVLASHDAIGTGETWCNPFWCQCHMLPLLSVSHEAETIKKKCTMTFWSCCTIDISTSITWCHLHLCWCHMTPLGLASVAHNNDSIINGTILFHSSRQLQWGATSQFGMWHHCHWCQHHGMSLALWWCHVTPLALAECYMMSIASPMAPLHSWCQDNQEKVQHDIWVMWQHQC